MAIGRTPIGDCLQFQNAVTVEHLSTSEVTLRRSLILSRKGANLSIDGPKSMLDLLADAVSSEKAFESTMTFDRGNVLDRRSDHDIINGVAGWSRWEIDRAPVIVSVVPATKDLTDDEHHGGSKHALTFVPRSEKFITSSLIQDGSRNYTLLLGVDVSATSRGAESGGGVSDVAHEREGFRVAEQSVSVSVFQQRAATEA